MNEDLYTMPLDDLEQVALGGDAVAAAEIADRYRTGRGVEQDEELAIEWEQRAKTLAEPPMVQTAMSHEASDATHPTVSTGSPAPASHPAAAILSDIPDSFEEKTELWLQNHYAGISFLDLRRAAAAKDPYACFMLAARYDHPGCTQAELTDANKYLHLTMDTLQEHVDEPHIKKILVQVLVFCGSFFRKNNLAEDAMTCYTNAYELDHCCAGFLAECYRTGFGCEQDMPRAIELLEEDAERSRSCGAYLALALVYYDNRRFIDAKDWAFEVEQAADASKHPDYCAAAKALAQCATAGGNVEALKACQASLEPYRDSQDALMANIMKRLSPPSAPAMAPTPAPKPAAVSDSASEPEPEPTPGVSYAPPVSSVQKSRFPLRIVLVLLLVAVVFVFFFAAVKKRLVSTPSDPATATETVAASEPTATPTLEAPAEPTPEPTPTPMPEIWLNELTYRQKSDSIFVSTLSDPITSNTGEQFAHYMYSEAAYHDIYYDCDGKYDTLTGIWMMTDEGKDDTNRQSFCIYADNVLVYTSPEISGGSLPAEVVADIAHCGTLCIEFVDSNGSAALANLKVSNASGEVVEIAPAAALPSWVTDLPCLQTTGSMDHTGAFIANTGVTLAHGLGKTTWVNGKDGSTSYYLEGKYTRFTAVCVIPSTSVGLSDPNIWSIYADDVLIYTSPAAPELNGGGLPVSIDLDVTGCQVLKMSYETEKLDNGTCYIANAKVYP